MRGLGKFVLAMLTASPALAATYHLEPVPPPVTGATDVMLTMLSATGDYTGVYSLPGQEYGFFRYHGRTTTLPPAVANPEASFVYPNTITLDGHVAGVYNFGNPYGAVFYHGRYLTTQISKDGYSAAIGLNDAGDVYLNVGGDDAENSAYIGTVHHLTPLVGAYTFITSMNEVGDIGGFAFINGGSFVRLGQRLHTLSDTKLSANAPVLINDARVVAGIGVSQRPGTSGSVLFEGPLHHFALFPLPASSMTAEAMNEPGTVAGTIAPTNQPSSVYTEKNGAFRTVATFPAGTTVTVVGITEHGDVGFVAQNAAGTTSYIAACSGEDC